MESEIESSCIGMIFTVLFFGYAVMQTGCGLRASDPANGSSQPIKSEETRNESLIDRKTLRLSSESEEQIRQPGNCAEEKSDFFQQWLGEQLEGSSGELEKIAQRSRPPRRLGNPALTIKKRKGKIHGNRREKVSVQQCEY